MISSKDMDLLMNQYLQSDLPLTPYLPTPNFSKMAQGLGLCGEEHKDNKQVVCHQIKGHDTVHQGKWFSGDKSGLLTW